MDIGEITEETKVENIEMMSIAEAGRKFEYLKIHIWADRILIHTEERSFKNGTDHTNG